MRHGSALIGGLLLMVAAPGTAGAPAAGALSSRAPEADVSPATSALSTDAPRASAVPQSGALALPEQRLPRLALVVLLIASILAAAVLAIALLALRRSRNRVAAANEQLHRTNASLEQALKVRTDFFATTSHEIRTPLNGILGMTQVLLADARLDPALQERIKAVHGAGETMKALVDDVLDMAKIENGGLTIDRAPLDLASLLAECVQLWRGLADSKGVRLELDLEQCPRRIEGDAVRLRQIVCNLLSNALKFTSQGSVRLFAFAESAGDGEELVLCVTDTGIGIPAEQQGFIFDRFRQADGSITPRFGGTGLGLTICRSLAEAMEGTISVESRPSEGCSFTVRLPLYRVEEEVAPVPPCERSGSVDLLAHARVLIVEENALTRRILCNVLGGFVGALEAVGSAEEATDRLKAGGIDHLVADAATGAGSGGRVAAALERLVGRAAGAGIRTTLLFSPNCADDAARLVALHPAIQPIAKPIATPALVGALDGLYAHGDTDPDRRVFAAASRG